MKDTLPVLICVVPVALFVALARSAVRSSARWTRFLTFLRVRIVVFAVFDPGTLRVALLLALLSSGAYSLLAC